MSARCLRLPSLTCVFVLLASIMWARPAEAQVSTMCTSGCTVDYRVDVTPDGSVTPTRQINTSGYTALFMVKNSGRVSSTFEISCSGSNGVTCTSQSATQITLAAGVTQKIFVGYSVANAGTGRLELRADGIAMDTGYWTIPIEAPNGAPGVAFKNLNGSNRDRSLCLTTGAGEAAAFQCGDLLVTHSMPGFTTMGRERELTLLYHTGQAYPSPIIAATVTMRANVATPSSIYTELRVNGVLRDSSTYAAWGNSTSSITRQIGLSYRAYINSTTDSSGVYPFTLLVRNIYANSIQDSVLTGRVMVVNRTASRFGGGWWLAGLEQLYFNQPVGTANGDILWVAGDGSAKLYARQPDGVSWVGAPGGFRDTLRYAGGVYTRHLRHGAKVTFNELGRHTATISRTGQQTTFGWSANLDTLTTITLPPAGAAGTSYALTYVGGVLDKIADPAGRVLDATITNGDLLTLKDPDNGTTSFTYNTSGNNVHQLVTRTNRRGVQTLYHHNVNRMVRVSIPLDAPAPTWAETMFRPWDHAGVTSFAHNAPATADDTAEAYTRIQGPRPNVADDAHFWVDQWGAPTKIVDATGATTTLVRGSTSHPALVTQVTYPNGRIATMSYTGRGNLDSLRDSTHHLDARPTQVRVYAYSTSGPALDSPSQVQDLINGQARTTAYKYNSLGLTDSVIAPNGHRTSFAYETGMLAGLVRSITEHGVETWREASTNGSNDTTDLVLDHVHRYTFDAKGNIRTYNSPAGVVTSYVTDAYGRVTDVYDPLNTRQERVYDAMNRVREVRRYTSPLAHPDNLDPLGTHPAQGQPCDPGQVLCVDSTVVFNPLLLPNPQVTAYGYDASGALDTIVDPRGMRRTFAHDARGLLWKATDDYGQSQTVAFNQAGAPDSTVSRRGIRVNSYYDAAGRRTAMAYPEVPSLDPAFAPATVPGDSIRYQYDIMGNVTKVLSNSDSIVREYYADGLLKRKISSVGPSTRADTISYEYDVTDAVTRVIHGRDTTDYAYHPTRGELVTMTVRWGGLTHGPRVFSFTWDALGRRRQITYPTDPSGGNNMTVKLRYDKMGTLRRLVSTHPGAPGGAGNDLLDAFDFSFRNKAVDAVGRIWRQELTCSGSQSLGNPCGNGGTRNTQNQYNRFGMLVRQEATGSSPEIMRYDGSGNMIYRSTFDDGLATMREDHFAVDSTAIAHSQLKRITEAAGRLIPLNILYTPDGARKWEKPDGAALDYRETYYYYDGLGRMAGSVERDDDQINQLHHNSGTCVYDPEGQLVVACSVGSVYLSFNGHNVSGAMYVPSDPYPDAGWKFVHGPGTDDPLIGYHRQLGTERILYYVTDGQGRVLAVADSSGYRSTGDAGTSVSRWRLAGGSASGNSFNADRMSGGDVPKLSFYRNRAYDQTTGRWTQEDPIGVAGGLNLYQFNGNNPVAYTDPFGLSPCPPCFNPLKAGVGAINVVRGAIGAAAGAALLTTGEALTPLGPVSVPAIALGSARLAGGLANVNRGAQQLSESLNDESGPSAKNLMGLLPFGQKFDDPGEPTVVEYSKDKIERFVKEPAATAKEAVEDFFAVED